MKNINYKIAILSTILLLGFLFITNQDVEPRDNLSAINGSDYIVLAPIRGIDYEDSGNDIGNLISNFFKIGIGITILLSILMIVYGGIKYMSSESPGYKSDAISKIQGAVAGLLLALSIWIILREINPRILSKDTNTILNPEYLRERLPSED